MKYLYKKEFTYNENTPSNLNLNVFTPKIFGKILLPGEDGNVKLIVVRILFQLISRGKTKIYYVSDGDALVHTSYVIPKCSKFPFLGADDYEIGPCFTSPAYRGRGIYPAVLRAICSCVGDDCATFYMIVDQTNIASIKGVEKAGFSRCGSVKVSKFTKRYQLEQML